MLNWKEVTTKPIEIHHAALSDGRKLQIDIAGRWEPNVDTGKATIRLLHPHWYQFEVLQEFEDFSIVVSPDVGAGKEKWDQYGLARREAAKNLKEKLFGLCVDYCESLFSEESAKQALAEADFCSVTHASKTWDYVDNILADELATEKTEKVLERCGKQCTQATWCADTCSKHPGHSGTCDCIVR